MNVFQEAVDERLEVDEVGDGRSRGSAIVLARPFPFEPVVVIRGTTTGTTLILLLSGSAKGSLRSSFRDWRYWACDNSTDCTRSPSKESRDIQHEILKIVSW